MNSHLLPSISVIGDESNVVMLAASELSHSDGDYTADNFSCYTTSFEERRNNKNHLSRAGFYYT